MSLIGKSTKINSQKDLVHLIKIADELGIPVYSGTRDRSKGLEGGCSPYLKFSDLPGCLEGSGNYSSSYLSQKDFIQAMHDHAAKTKPDNDIKVGDQVKVSYVGGTVGLSDKLNIVKDAVFTVKRFIDDYKRIVLHHSSLGEYKFNVTKSNTCRSTSLLVPGYSMPKTYRDAIIKVNSSTEKESTSLKVGDIVSSETLNKIARLPGNHYHRYDRWMVSNSAFCGKREVLKIERVKNKLAFQILGTITDIWLSVEGYNIVTGNTQTSKQISNQLNTHYNGKTIKVLRPSSKVRKGPTNRGHSVLGRTKRTSVAIGHLSYKTITG